MESLLFFLIVLAEDKQVIEHHLFSSGVVDGGRVLLAQFVLEEAGGYKAPASLVADNLFFREAITRGG